MTIKPIAILGCGPSGLLAAWAATLANRPFVILSNPRKSGLGGAQYLHKPITGLTDPETAHMVTYRMVGDPMVYFEKAYGMPLHHFDADWWKPENQEPAWNLMAYYDQLWDLFSPFIEPIEITHAWVTQEMKLGYFDMIVSTIPLHAICDPMVPHFFNRASIRIKPEFINPNIPDNEIWYDGTPDYSWYRQSNVFGHGNTEWGPNAPEKLPYPNLIKGSKPVSTNCNCWPTIVKVGRYGRWAKSEHTHDAFQHAAEALAERYGANILL